jgi:cobyrinic acid a,c-diamide synthase
MVVAGLAGDTGKTLVAVGLARALHSRGWRVAPFKKGPDFIDAAWLGAAAATAGRNLDTFLMGEAAVIASLARSRSCTDVAIIEGNRGLFDGLDAQGSHSTARLATLTRTPVLLVVDATKVTRTAAALVLGCRALDPELCLAGVVLNQVATARQEQVIREAVTQSAKVPVLGAIPRLVKQHLPSRHLGLVTAIEHPATAEVLDRLGQLIEQNVDVSAVLDEARRAPALATAQDAQAPPATATGSTTPSVRIGVLTDRAFTFYYPENLEALQAAGAELHQISPLRDDELPDIDALYAGGGFPEQYAVELSRNEPLRAALATRIAEGLPVWAECGGLAYLAEALVKDGVSHRMVGALPIVVEQTPKPQGHGYVQAQVDAANPFFAERVQLRGHEFHYSRLVTDPASVPTALRLDRGVGVGQHRDGILAANVLATYTHLHALGTPDWAAQLVQAARRGTAHAGRASAAGPRGRQPAEPSLRRGSAEVFPAAFAAPRREQAEQRMNERQAVVSRLRRARRRTHRRLGSQVRAAVEQQRTDELERLAASEPRAVRHLLALTYQADETLRRTAARAVARAGRYHPRLVQNVIRRLVWAMNDESGTNAVTAPGVLQAIAEEQPELLLPAVPDLIRLAADESLREGLAGALRLVASRCPGKVGQGLAELLNRRGQDGGCGGVRRNT